MLNDKVVLAMKLPRVICPRTARHRERASFRKTKSAEDSYTRRRALTKYAYIS